MKETEGKSPPEVLGFSTYAIERLGKKKCFPRERSYQWSAAILGSTDYASPDFKKALAGENPNGYLIGVGAGGILALIESFRTAPIAIIATDIDPNVVATGRILVDVLKTADSFEDVVANFFKLSGEDYESKIRKITEADPALAQGFARWQTDRNDTPMDAWDNAQNFPEKYSRSINVPAVIERNFLVLRQLATEDKIAFCYADITNKGFIDFLSDLPEFNNSTNVIYLSNAIALPGAKINSYKGIRKVEHTSERCVYAHRPMGDSELQISRSVEAIIDSIKANNKRGRRHSY